MDRKACAGVLEYMVPVIGNNLPDRFLNSDFFCEEVFPVCKTHYQQKYVDDFEEEVLLDKPEHTKDNNFINDLYD